VRHQPDRRALHHRRRGRPRCHRARRGAVRPPARMGRVADLPLLTEGKRPQGIPRLPWFSGSAQQPGSVQMSRIGAAATDIAQLVDGARINGRVYSDPDVFELEMDRLFGRAWIILGHESRVPERGSYFLGRVGRAPVIVVRNDAGGVSVLHNRCAHRGPAVCARRTGRARNFVCPYHGWTYDLTGRLVSVPLKEDYGDAFPWEKRRLEPVARTAMYRGFIFASLAA